MKIMTNLDINNNEISNAVVSGVSMKPLETAPENPVEGEFYYNTTEKKAFQYNGTEWKAMGGASGNIVALTPETEEEIAMEDVAFIETKVTDPEAGDMIVVKRLIADDKYTHSTYVYNETNGWVAADGSYNAENVYFDSDLMITANVGVHTIDASTGSKTINIAGKNVKQAMDTLFAAEKNPTATLPNVVIDTSHQYKEVGATVTPTFSAHLDPGKYTYGPATGITAKTWSVTFGDETVEANSGSFTDITITEGECCKIKGTATYDASTATPLTNLENPYTDTANNLPIQAGSDSTEKNLFTGYRPNFYWFETATKTIADINSDYVRTSTGKHEYKNQGTTTTPAGSATAKASWMQFFYAMPKGRKSTLSVVDSNGLPCTVKTTEITVNHEGEASSTYTLFYIENDAVYGATTLTLTWA